MSASWEISSSCMVENTIKCNATTGWLYILLESMHTVLRAFDFFVADAIDHLWYNDAIDAGSQYTTSNIADSEKIGAVNVLVAVLVNKISREERWDGKRENLCAPERGRWEESLSAFVFYMGPYSLNSYKLVLMLWWPMLISLRCLAWTILSFAHAAMTDTVEDVSNVSFGIIQTINPPSNTVLF